MASLSSPRDKNVSPASSVTYANTTTVQASPVTPTSSPALITPKPVLSSRVTSMITSEADISDSRPTPIITKQKKEESPSLTELLSPYITITPEPPKHSDLEKENTYLRQRVAELEYTTHALTERTIQIETQHMLANCPSTTRPVDSDSCPPCLGNCVSAASLADTERRHAEDQDLITNMRTTIEVLQAEVECLRNEKKMHASQQDTPDWQIVQPSKSKPRRLSAKNKYKAPSYKDQGGIDLSPLTVNKIRPNRKQHKPKKQNPMVCHGNEGNKNSNLHFTAVKIYGDSHVRCLAKMTGELLEGCSVTGVCKPSARLLSIVPSQDATPTCDSGCLVLMAGANDVAAGKPEGIYSHLGQILHQNRHRSMVLSTLPYRYDLPAHHPINNEVALANAFIERTAARHPHVTILSINEIKRRHFTRHGLHLALRGKRVLARMIVDCLRAASAKSTRLEQPDAVFSPSNVSGIVAMPTAPEPITQHHDSYADAVKSSSACQTTHHSVELPAATGCSALTTPTPSENSPEHQVKSSCDNFLDRLGHPQGGTNTRAGDPPTAL